MIKKNIARSCEDIERALKFSIPILLSPLSHAYFDVPYAEPSADPRQEERRLGVGQRAYAPKSIAETFDWDPAEALGPNAPLANLAGVGSAIWGETIKDFTDLTFMLLPRLAGIAEKGWSDTQVSSWADHRARLAAHGRLWSQDGLTYFKSSTVDWEPERSSIMQIQFRKCNEEEGPADDRHLHQDHFDGDRGLLGGDRSERSLASCQCPIRTRVRWQF